MIKTYINYKVRNGPWGGINSFMKAFISSIKARPDVILYDEPKFGEIDIFLQSAANNGGDGDLTMLDFEEILKERDKNKFKFIMRLDGLRSIYSGVRSESDNTQLELSKVADKIIFQSNASLKQYQQYGYNKNNYSIVYNGVDQSIFFPVKHKTYNQNKLKIFAASWSSNPLKGFKVISEISLLDNVEMTFAGRWDSNTPLNRVKLIDAVPQTELAQIYREQDIFLHAAENDSCPNVVLEALSCGLPIIYNTSGGTPELASGYGVPINGSTQNYFREIIKTLTNNYNDLRNKILEDQYKFSIENARDKYIDVFFETQYGNPK